MKLHSKKLAVLSLLIVASVVLAACGGAPSEPQVVVETVIVEGTPQVVEVEVPAAEAGGQDLDATIAAEEQVACNPLPELAFSGTGAGAASVGTGVSAAPAAPVAGDDAQTAVGNIYRVGIFEDVTTTNYWGANGPDNTVWNSYILGPEVLAPFALAHQTFQLVPSAAADWATPVVQDGDLWVSDVTFRDDIFWSDGEQFTAEDWAFTANVVKDFGLISGNWVGWYDYGTNLDHIEADADDPLVAHVYYYAEPGLFTHEFGTLTSPILPEHFWAPLIDEAGAYAPLDGVDEADEEGLLAAQTEAQNILFSIEPNGEPTAGMTLLSQREPGAFIQADKNTTFYGEGTTVTEYENGAYQEVQADEVFNAYGEPEGEPVLTVEVGPFVDAVVYTVYSSQDAALLALKNGEIDYVLNPLGLQAGLMDQVESDPNLTRIDNGVNGFRYLSFNLRRQPMNYCSFRQAVAVLIDKEFVTGTVLQNVAFPLYSYVPEANGAWYYDEVPKLGQGLDREQRIELAKAILKQDGFTWEGDEEPVWSADDGYTIPGGRLLLPDGTAVPNLGLLSPPPSYDPLRSTFATWIEAWLNEFGIPVSTELVGFNVSIPIIFTEQDFDMYILGWSLGITPRFLRDFWHSSQAVEDGNNAGGYDNPEFDTASDELLTCKTVEECKGLADNLQLLLATETPYVLLFDTGIIEAYRNASVEYPYTDTLSGLQYSNIAGGSGLVDSVNVK